MERRLAAILAADVVGYSRLMEADEEATARTLSTYREIIEGLVAGPLLRGGDPARSELWSRPCRARHRLLGKPGQLLGEKPRDVIC